MNVEDNSVLERKIRRFVSRGDNGIIHPLLYPMYSSVKSMSTSQVLDISFSKKCFRFICELKNEHFVSLALTYKSSYCHYDKTQVS